MINAAVKRDKGLHSLSEAGRGQNQRSGPTLANKSKGAGENPSPKDRQKKGQIHGLRGGNAGKIHTTKQEAREPNSHG